jgi:hypothetical protein
VFELPRVLLEHEIGGKPLNISFDCLHQRLGSDLIEIHEVGAQHDFVAGA